LARHQISQQEQRQLHLVATERRRRQSNASGRIA
jgi:hypothetical protein